jgi:hypothetical protein
MAWCLLPMYTAVQLDVPRQPFLITRRLREWTETSATTQKGIPSAALLIPGLKRAANACKDVLGNTTSTASVWDVRV